MIIETKRRTADATNTPPVSEGEEETIRLGEFSWDRAKKELPDRWMLLAAPPDGQRAELLLLDYNNGLRKREGLLYLLRSKEKELVFSTGEQMKTPSRRRVKKILLWGANEGEENQSLLSERPLYPEL